MRKNVFGRQLKRTKNERKALFKSLLSSLVLKEKITTTEDKAKAIKGQADKLITFVKKGRKDTSWLQKYLIPDAIQKLISHVGPRFEKRQGGYTRIVKLGRRFSDSAAMAVIEWVEQAKTTEKASAKKVTKEKQPKKV